jgi:hypothetical protein
MDDELDAESYDLFTGVEEASEDGVTGDGISITPEDRPRGILSPTDRDYLCGLKEYAQPQTDANRRQDIRERVVNGLQDFELLWSLLEDEEREKVFEELGPDQTDEVIAAMITFAYLGIDQETTRMEEYVGRGILGGANADKLFRSSGRATEANVSIDIEYNPDLEKLYRRFKDGGQLSDADLGVLVRSGMLDSEEIDQIRDSPGSIPVSYHASN